MERPPILETHETPYWVDQATSRVRPEEDDEYLYHVTGEHCLLRIAEEGFRYCGPGGAGRGGGYEDHSRDRIFFTDRSGLGFWIWRIEDHLFHSMDEPPELAVVRLRKCDLEGVIEPDELGIRDARAPSWYVKSDDLEALEMVCMNPEYLEEARHREASRTQRELDPPARLTVG